MVVDNYDAADKIDFTRDIIAYMVVLAVIVAVVYDGKVNAWHRALQIMLFNTILIAFI